jgi:hypothetical protein
MIAAKGLNVLLIFGKHYRLIFEVHIFSIIGYTLSEIQIILPIIIDQLLLVSSTLDQDVKTVVWLCIFCGRGKKNHGACESMDDSSYRLNIDPGKKNKIHHHS